MKRHLCLFLAIGLAAQSASSQDQIALQNSPAYEAVASRLRNGMPRDYEYQGAILADVLRVMASDAGLSFFGLPDGTPEAERLVTFSIKASPFIAMETLAKANGISLIYENSMWYLRPANDTELVGRVYQINYNSQELVTKTSGGAGMGISGGSGSGSGGGLGGGGGIGGGLSLQGMEETFKTEPSQLLEHIKSILDLPTNGSLATIAPTISVDTLTDLSARNLPGRPDVMVQAQRAVDSKGKPLENSNPAKVIWNSDSNTLFVVATRQQHQWIEGYLASADVPQALIAVEIKFVETSKDPSREFGIDWTQTLGNGWGVNAALPSHEADLADLANSYALPAAVLSYDEINLKLRALFEDRKTKTVSYPRMLTLNNREVAFRNVRNEPVLANSSSTSLGAGATNTSAVDYLPIGTVVNILPKKMDNGNITLNVAITISDIIGEKMIEGNPFPIASSRVYTAPIQVKSGYTVAISGLDAAHSDRNKTGVPVLGRIPILGHAFKASYRRDSKQHLMMLITPTLMQPTGPGVSKKPISRDPWADMAPSHDDADLEIEDEPPPPPAKNPRRGYSESADVTPVAPSHSVAAAPAADSGGPRVSTRRYSYARPSTGPMKPAAKPVQRPALVARPVEEEKPATQATPPAPAAFVSKIEDPIDYSAPQAGGLASTLERAPGDASASTLISSAPGPE